MQRSPLLQRRCPLPIITSLTASA